MKSINLVNSQARFKSFTFLLLAFILIFQSGYSAQLDIQFDSEISQMPVIHQKKLSDIFQLIEEKLPPQFVQIVQSKKLIIKSALLSPHQEIPLDLCTNNDSKFIFGSFNKFNNVLTLHSALIKELLKEEKETKIIACLHKSIYRQSLATIIHELTHAYDLNSGHPSQSIEFRLKAGFKKGIIRVKNKNKEAMRSPDPYELVSLRESFAVNMEYYLLDPEFSCRRPSLYQYYKKHFQFTPSLAEKCRTGHKILVSNSLGFYPFELKNSRVYRIDYLLASAGNEIMSGFGHSMFRIVTCADKRIDPITKVEIPATPMGPKCLNDRFHHLVVSFRANVEDSKLNYMKGLTGGYPSMLFILNFPDVLDEYNKDELRDVISYPLKLNTKEIEDFLNRVKEDHWNYRGDYKFITNNCAVESADVFKGALSSKEFNQSFSLTPNGVLKDFISADLVQLNDPLIETFSAHTEDSLFALDKAFSVKQSSNIKKNKEALLKFIQKSKAEDRKTQFEQFIKNVPFEIVTSQNVKVNDLRKLKSDIVKASSFSVVEQQILRTKSLEYRKKAGEYFLNGDDQEINDFVKESKKLGNFHFKDHFFAGYGIPLDSEVISLETVIDRFTNNKERIKKAEELLFKYMPTELNNLEFMNKNIKLFNENSLRLRKMYRQNFENYIMSSLSSLKNGTDSEQMLFQNARQGQLDSIIQLRANLGADIVTEKEILDTKLLKLINLINERTN